MQVSSKLAMCAVVWCASPYLASRPGLVSPGPDGGPFHPGLSGRSPRRVKSLHVGLAQIVSIASLPSDAMSSSVVILVSSKAAFMERAAPPMPSHSDSILSQPSHSDSSLSLPPGEEETGNAVAVCTSIVLSGFRSGDAVGVIRSGDAVGVLSSGDAGSCARHDDVLSSGDAGTVLRSGDAGS